MNFVKASLKYKQVTLSVLLLMFVAGIHSLINMPRREDPKITIPAGLVTVYYPGADAIQVEEEVTRKLEEYIFRFGEVEKEKTHSTTTDGMAVVNIWLRDNVRQPDIFWSKLRHELMVVRNADLPAGVIGPVVNSDFGDTEAMVIAFSGEKADYNQLKESAIKLEEALLTFPATSKIKRIGEQREEVTIAYNSRKLSQYGIGLTQVVKALQSQNMLSASGNLPSGTMDTPLYTGGIFRTMNDIGDQIIGASGTGALIRLKDIATLERGLAEPAEKISVMGEKAILLTVQMHEGNNVVKFGNEVKKAVKEVSLQLPPEVKITTIVDQPLIVNRNVSRFLREFLMSIAAVILVVFLILPLNIAMVAAMAIPMTVSVTFALLHILGIELHQVSLAAMIVVLGMVVDDAIIIADNYVELLDRGNDRRTSAWQSATQLVVPVMTATITIIAAFFPMIILTGTIGEFIHALPITVTIALSASFIVAMFLTPMLCYTFIRKGLNRPDAGNEPKKRASLLMIMQKNYNKSLDWCFRHSAITIAGSLLTIGLAVLLFAGCVRHKFFPEAERNQFSVELWMPTGTSLDNTEIAIRKIEEIIKKDARVVTFATFIGRSAPRFYYNYSPEYPASNFAQILINTTSNKTTLSLCRELNEKLDQIVPQGRPQAILMQQGQPLHSPVEVRISGGDLIKLQETGEKVKKIIRDARGSKMVRTDFKENYYGLNIRPRPEASRMGFSTSSVSQSVFAGFEGYTVSTMYEGAKAVPLVLKLDEKSRENMDDLYNTMIGSPVTGTAVPLRQIAVIHPEWKPGRIKHRNGIRTLTIQSETTGGILASELLKEIKPLVAQIELPPGLHIYYGGESANKNEVMGRLFTVLIISLIAIFIVLMFQFRNLKEVGLVMLTIPMSLLGAITGLIVTGNDFGFTAFVGLISLSGIVVRNAIILIDHTNELLGKGISIPEAAIMAGKRRLRPIFLTASAAAIGVWPMILSGSQLWSPAASVIAFGLLWSMLITTLAVPVLYVALIKPADKNP